MTISSPRLHSRRLAATLLAGAILLSGSGVLAQSAAAVQARPEASEEDSLKAQAVRDDFMKVLERYPPAVAAVLKLDQSLIASDQYLAPYPAIGAFLAEHPEVRRSPAYYLERVRTAADSSSYLYDSRARAWDRMTEAFTIIGVMGIVVGGLAWLIRTAIDYRRWGRLARVQAEAHTKLLDRFTGNEELLAYVQSPAGARFLESAPIALDGAPRTMAAPLSRILWSMQAGVVLIAAGIGMNYVSRTIDPDRSDPIFTLSVVLISVGFGFLASSGLSYLMSRRLGLIDRSGAEAEETRI
jgi:hypothetical protein